MSRTVDLIVIHCSASPDGVSLFEGAPGTPEFCTPVEVIDRWHAKRGFRRALQARQMQNERLGSIGYHLVIYVDGTIAPGRAFDEIGAHVFGYSRTSIGVCMIGTERFTREQWRSLARVIELLRLKHPGARVCGHRDLSPDVDGDGIVERWEWLKTSPGFDVAAWIAAGMQPDPKDIFTPPVKETP